MNTEGVSQRSTERAPQISIEGASQMNTEEAPQRSTEGASQTSTEGTSQIGTTKRASQAPSNNYWDTLILGIAAVAGTFFKNLYLLMCYMYI